MIDFARTHMGKRFFESTLPDLVLQVRRVANALEAIADILRAGTERKDEPHTPKETRG
ncbi:MAG: hypothetical protein ACLQVI_01910 [Polyangiaceae bacterium]